MHICIYTYIHEGLHPLPPAPFLWLIACWLACCACSLCLLPVLCLLCLLFVLCLLCLLCLLAMLACYACLLCLLCVRAVLACCACLLCMLAVIGLGSKIHPDLVPKCDFERVLYAIQHETLSNKIQKSRLSQHRWSCKTCNHPPQPGAPQGAGRYM